MIETAQYRHVTYGIEFKVERGPKVYGPVRRGGKVFYRNYRREIPNGLCALDLMELRTKAAHARLLEMCGVTDMMRGVSRPVLEQVG